MLTSVKFPILAYWIGNTHYKPVRKTLGAIDVSRYLSFSRIRVIQLLYKVDILFYFPLSCTQYTPYMRVYTIWTTHIHAHEHMHTHNVYEWKKKKNTHGSVFYKVDIMIVFYWTVYAHATQRFIAARAPQPNEIERVEKKHTPHTEAQERSSIYIKQKILYLAFVCITWRWDWIPR